MSDFSLLTIQQLTESLLEKDRLLKEASELLFQLDTDDIYVKENRTKWLLRFKNLADG